MSADVPEAGSVFRPTPPAPTTVHVVGGFSVAVFIEVVIVTSPSADSGALR
jgi:hypothetical protein